MNIYSDTLHLLIHNLVTDLDIITDFGLISKLREVSIEHLQRILIANRGHLLLPTPGPLPFGTFICSNVTTGVS